MRRRFSWSEELNNLLKAQLELKEKLRAKGDWQEGRNKEVIQLHKNQAKWFFDHITKQGFPTLSSCGEQVTRLAWYVACQLVSVPHFLRDFLSEARMSASMHDYPLELLAVLEDKVAILEGRKQLYGTQLDWQGDELLPRPVEDPTQLNYRRKSFGMAPLEESLEHYRLMTLSDGERPPQNPDKRKNEWEKWRKDVGWAA